MEKIYRRATLEDREGVLLISPDLYNGTDYLPHIYNSVIRDHRGYVCEENGQIIGFGMITIVDGGETAMRRAGRVIESHQGQGVLRDLSDYMTRDLYTIPNMKFSSMATNNNLDILKGYITRENFRIVMKVKIMVVCYKISELQIDTPSPVDNIVTTEVDNHLLVAILNCGGSRDYLFPEGFVRINYVLFKPSEDNLEHFLNEETYVVGSFNKEQKRPETIRLLTIASFFPCQAGTAYIIDIFGDKIEDFHSHLCLHFEKLEKLTDGFVGSDIIFGKDTNIEHVQATIRQFNIGSPRDRVMDSVSYRKTL